MNPANSSTIDLVPDLRAAAESVLRDGETLQAFVEGAMRARIERRQFIARGLASAEEARRTGVYYTAEEVLAELRAKLDKARAAKPK
ncbi:prevent-host-death protein [Rhizobium sp. S163]|uniref:prevent-host-death protein n=1 Tax=Rhizobium sp. S163 TaxID=3055039 RepID=UPI0025AA039E|nr:prevent-host-death protein [Rhizobium sp. S163]MDM9647823.1 prevent-host-death protein [Rhizobium sp. S163]